MSVSSAIRWRNRCLAAVILGSIFVLLGLKIAQPINLTAVDIGRHIKNGELLLQGHPDILRKNFYSFTHPDYPFINHHWLFGVFSYWVWRPFGFEGVSLAFVGVVAATLFFFLRAALLRGHFALGVFLTLLALPIICDRREIRPEAMSNLFMGLYFYVLTKLSLGQIKAAWAYVVLGLSQIIWVNTHIFFFMGPLLTSVFLWEGAGRGCSVCVKHLRPLLALTIGVNLLNPSGLAGVLTPLNVFKGFGYRLAENQNVFFMMSFFPQQTLYKYFLVIAAVALIGAALAVWARGWKANLAFIVLLLFVTAAGFKAVRLMTPFAFFFIPLAAFMYGQAEGRLSQKIQNGLRVLLLILSSGLIVYYASAIQKQPPAVGLMPKINASAEFFKSQGLKGPIFSNYDIGGYLIYHLAPQEKVFVDNRQEAFPPDFFKNVYIPMEEDSTIWNKIDSQYGFNVIYFYRHDLTPWGQNFLISRLDDARWAPVFVDDYTIIFLKRSASNQALINRFELPRSMFGIVHKSS